MKWIYDYFIKQNPDGGEFIDEHIPVQDGAKVITRSRIFIRSRLQDNRYYYETGAYEANLKQLTERERQWYLEGNWLSGGQGYFADLLTENHAMTPFSVPRNWQMCIGIHFEEGTPAYAVIAVRDTNNRLYFIQEVTQEFCTGQDLGAALALAFKNQHWTNRRKWSQWDAPGFVNPSEEAETAIASSGFSVFPAATDKVAGWRQMRERLKAKRRDRPMMFVVRERCPFLWEQLQQVQRDEGNPADVTDDMEHHALNAARNVCAEWPIDLYYEEHDENAELFEMERLLAKSGGEGIVSGGYGD
jgi:hypothetical protein